MKAHRSGAKAYHGKIQEKYGRIARHCTGRQGPVAAPAGRNGESTQCLGGIPLAGNGDNFNLNGSISLDEVDLDKESYRAHMDAVKARMWEVLGGAGLSRGQEDELIRAINQQVALGETRREKHEIATNCIEQLAFEFGQ